jgi:PleD family two-component response regulator
MESSPEAPIKSAGWHRKTIGVTISIGVAFAPEDGTTPESLLTAADARLLAGKRSGRNVVCYRRND